ncbi:MinD/ParA family protein [bacterium]|nr:MinD/ParA family protein [bacterium]MBU1614754.1 MinD/ParA family protein [bacterium]
MADQAERLRELTNNVRQFPRAVPEHREEKGCRVITVSSGKGGVGKTNIAANLALSFSYLGKKVAVLDADLGLSNVNIVMGLVPPPRYNLSHIISGKKKLKEVMAEAPLGVKIIAGAVGASEIANLAKEQRDEFIKELSTISQFADLLIIDTGAGVSNNVLDFILAAKEVILVTTPEPTAITDAYGMIKVITGHEAEIDIKLIVNRASSFLEGKKVADRIADIAGQFLSVHIEKLGYVLEDPLVGKSIREQTPFILKHPTSKAASCIKHIRNKLANVPEEPKKFTSFFSRLFKR